MPLYKKTPTLYELSLHKCAKLVHGTLRKLDDLWKPPNTVDSWSLIPGGPRSSQSSPGSSVISSPQTSPLSLLKNSNLLLDWSPASAQLSLNSLLSGAHMTGGGQASGSVQSALDLSTSAQGVQQSDSNAEEKNPVSGSAQISGSAQMSRSAQTSECWLSPGMQFQKAQEERQLVRLYQVQLVAWLNSMPLLIQEDLVREILTVIEDFVTDDKDRKLILTLINIESSKPSSFFFGVHSLLTCLADSPVTKLPFSARLSYCLWEYEQMTSSSILARHMCQTLPKLRNLVKLNLAHLATDKICYLLSRHNPHLEDLLLDKSELTDKGIKYLAGHYSSNSSGGSSSGSSSGLPSHKSPIRAISFDNEDAESGPSTSASTNRKFGCQKLKYLSLKGCDNLSGAGVWFILTRLKELRILCYHEDESLGEVIVNSLSQCPAKEVQSLILKLAHFTHPFPYALKINQDIIRKMVAVFPHITVLNVVTDDKFVEHFKNMSGLKSVVLELEDCFGLGLYAFLETLGHKLEEVSISCSSDPGSSQIPGGGTAHQLFNVALKLARRFCLDQLKKLSVAGCGLVANDLLDVLAPVSAGADAGAGAGTGYLYRPLPQLESLMFLFYEEDCPVQTCERRILFDTLIGCPRLKCLSLEGNFSSYFDDDFVSGLLSHNPLSHLEIWDICGTQLPMTTRSAQLLVKLDRIRELRMSRWTMTKDQFDQLEDKVKREGWDLVLTRRLKPTSE